MTSVERNRLLHDDFDTIWDELWGSEYEISQKYANNRVISKEKLMELRNGIEVQGENYTLESLLRREPVLYETPEWGFPKGRRDPYEPDITCAYRELKEESGITEGSLWKILNVNPFVEQFYGSNNIHYRHTYYVAQYVGRESIDFDTENHEMAREIGNLAWKNLDEALLILRPENVEKRGIIIQLANLLRNFSPVLRTRLHGVKTQPIENNELEQEKYVFTATEDRSEQSSRPFRARARDRTRV